MRFALVTSTNVVENVIIWGGSDPFWNDLLPIELEPNEPCSPGWIYDPSASPRFIEPSEV